MSETLIKDKDGQLIWTAENIERDLKKAGLEEIVIIGNHSDSVGHLGRYKGEKYNVSWIKDALLMVTMKKDGPLLTQLADAYSKVVDYKPFCKYTEELGGMKTYEWAKNDAFERIAQLKSEGKKDLTLFL
ncbi:MAG: hypothetical protein WCK29_01325 [archaeon]